MKTSRRDFIKYSGLFVTSLYLGCSTNTHTNKQITEPESEEKIIKYFESKGFKQYPKHNLITEHDFNHGLRYDDEPIEKLNGKWMRLQDCGRVEDILKSNDLGMLAYFHILTLANFKPKFQGEMLSEVLVYLINEAGLDPRKIILVSTDWINPYKAHIDNFNINTSQIILRPYREIIAERDGSGLYSVKDHPYDPNYPTVSIHYIVDNGKIKQKHDYRSIQELEICEISLNVGPNEKKNTEFAAIGIERLKMAQGHNLISYEESKNQLISALENEANYRNIDLPKAHTTFNKI
ncbi:MAG: hypothetical protein ACR2NW_09920 [Thermodesulfobacteriota bacterium]